jgi:hypothetical protein
VVREQRRALAAQGLRGLAERVVRAEAFGHAREPEAAARANSLLSSRSCSARVAVRMASSGRTVGAFIERV